MSHEPPVPPESTSPYPIQPPPTRKKAKRKQPAHGAKSKTGGRAMETATPGTALVVLDQAETQETSGASGGRTGPMIGVGAAVALGAAAAVTGLFYAKRRSAAAATKSKRSSEAGAKRSGDDKRKRGGSDRRRVAAGQPYEVSYFARKHGLSASDARAIIKQAGNDRDKANRLAGQRKSARS